MRIFPENELKLSEVAKIVFAAGGREPAKNVDKEQLAIGLAVELEHTDDPHEAETIARQHLAEDPEYYTAPMEKDWGADEAKARIEEMAKMAQSLSFDDLMHYSPMTTIDLKNQFGVTNQQAKSILQLYAPAAFGQNGKGKEWFIEQIKRLMPPGSNCQPKQKLSSVFVLEDDPERINIFKSAFGEANVVVTKSTKEALELLRTRKFAKIFLDRDLSSLHESGEDVAWQMSQERICEMTPVVIHSENTRGQRVMARYLNGYHSDVSVIPFRKLRRSLEVPGYRVAQTELPKYRKNKSGDTAPAYPNDPLARAVADTGGTLRYVNLPKSFPPGKNGGCGTPTIMNGTGGGNVPCGSRVKMTDGTISDPVYCYFCDKAIHPKPDVVDTDSLKASIDEFSKKNANFTRDEILQIISRLITTQENK